MEEVWKPVKVDGAESELLVSSLGRVKHVSYLGGLGWHGGKKRMISNKILNPSDNGNGYKYITVQVGKQRKHLYVHRLVAETFLPKVEGKEYVNHIDYNRGNNEANNLEWCTVSENLMHSSKRMQHPKPNARVGKYGRAIKRRPHGFEVNVYHARKQYYCGTYKTVEEAEKARDAKYAELGVNYKDWE